jgi:hypothetical protein
VREQYAYIGLPARSFKYSSGTQWKNLLRGTSGKTEAGKVISSLCRNA